MIVNIKLCYNVFGCEGMKYFVNSKLVIIVLLLLVFPISIKAKGGCCSRHGGVAGCSESGRQVCSDGTLSPSCTCTPTVSHVYGCTDSKAKNYNSKATKDDGSCKYYVYGCMDSKAKNYNSKAEKSDDSCEYYVYGCTDKDAENYNVDAEKDDGTCTYKSSTVSTKDDSKVSESSKDEISTSDDDSDLFLPILVVGGIGAAGYYLQKKKKNM